MLAKVLSSAVTGVDGLIVEVEVDIVDGLPSFSTVGLPEVAVRESKDRVKAAIVNSGYKFPARRITVNLAPADLKKAGTGYDMPIALGILAASKIIGTQMLKQYAVIGELSLDGGVRPARGILPMAIAARDAGLKGIVIPQTNGFEATVVDGIDVIGVETLHQAVEFLIGLTAPAPVKIDIDQTFRSRMNYDEDYSEVKGQEHARRALEIAAAGGHNILMKGPPGSGKTMLARRLPTILPDLSFDEALETTRVYSVMGLLPQNMGLLTTRPFRAPHHTISDAGLIGGGQIPRPGEVSLAHNGVLFLDEFPEFKKNVLEVMRQPMEDGIVTISRAATSLTFPARFMLVAAMNPCPCGFLGDQKHECTCTPLQIQRYVSRISGPLLDRIDLHLEVPAVPFKDMSDNTHAESSADIRNRVIKAVSIQKERFKKHKKMKSNGSMRPKDLRKYCILERSSEILLEKAMSSLGLSARAYHRIIRISRTIADLSASDSIRYEHVAEAVQYRRSIHSQ